MSEGAPPSSAPPSPPSSSATSSHAGRVVAGRYRITGELGRGASSMVLAAVDRWFDDRRVALKVLSNPYPELARNLAEEFALLFRIRHPHIARVFESGRLRGELDDDRVPDDAPFLAEELYEGVPAHLWAVDRSPGEIAAVGAQIASALATLHAQGIRHGDVKPENILVSGDRCVAKLIDFGLASRSPPTGISGTPRYMAREALDGRAECASDVYGLGATLVTLICQQPPEGPHGSAQTAPALGTCIEAMTHESVGQRAHAAEAFDLLTERAEEPLQSHLLELREGGSVVQAFCGGTDVIRALDRAVAARRGVIRIGGVPGSGKSAALAEAVCRAVRAGLSVPGAVRSGASGQLAVVDAAIAELHGRIPDADAEPPAEDVPPVEDMRTGLWPEFLQRAEALASAATNHAAAIIVDDVPAHSPLDEFGRFLSRLDEPPLLWVQAGGEEPDVSVSPLTVPTVAAMLRVMRPLRPHDADVASAIHEATGGNPAAISSLLVSLPGDDLPRAARDGTLWEAPKSDELFGMSVDRRLRLLDDAERRLVAAVACLEPPVVLSLLRHVPSLEGALGALSIDRACALGLLSDRTTETEAALDTAGELLRRRLRQTADIALLQELAQTLENLPRALRRKRTAEVGLLWSRLGDAKRAAPHLLAGARRAVASHRLADALELYDRLLDQGGLGQQATLATQVESGRVLLAQGRGLEAMERFTAGGSHPGARLARAEAALSLGRYEQAASELDSARDAGLEPAELCALEALAARAHVLRGDYDAAAAVIQAAQTRQSPHPEAARLSAVDGLIEFYRGQPRRARSMLESAIELTDEPRLLETLHANLGLILHKSGDLHAAEAAYGRALEGAETRRDLPAQVLRLANLAALRQEQGRFDAALETYGRAESLARLIDGRRESVRVRLNRANLLNWLGDVATATLLVKSALADAAGLQMPTEEAYLHLVHAELCLASADSDAAEASQARARRLFARSDNRAGIAECDAVAAEIALHRRQLTEARRLGRSAASQAAAIGRERIETQALLWQALADFEESTPSEGALRAAERASRLADDADDPDLGWLAHAVLGRLFAQLHRRMETEFHLAKARQLGSEARSRLSARYEKSYLDVWYRRAPWALTRQSPPEAAEQPTRSFDRLLAINRELAQDHNPNRLLERIIDAAIALSGAERGFIVLSAETTEPGGPTTVESSPDGSLAIGAARNIDRQSLSGSELDISRSIAEQAVRTGMPVTSIDAQGDERFSEFLSVHALKLRSVLCLPLRASGRILGALYLDDRNRTNTFSETDIALLSAFGDQAAIALSNAQLVSQLERRTAELESSRSAIEELNQRLESELAARAEELAFARTAPREPQPLEQHGMIGRSPAMVEIYRIIDRVADHDVPVTILGESGTGKELVARAIHAASERRTGAFVSINCAAIPAELLESELFGHERGAFTGAVRAKPGLFEVAEDGTLFLDEIGDMPLEMQVKLLRVLQQKEFRRVGGTAQHGTNARVISASNRDLEAMVRAGEFREDLWYRLNVVEIRVPPLRARREDLPGLIDHLLQRHGAGAPPALTPRARGALLDHPWHGNVRELENEIMRAIALCDGTIDVEALSEKIAAAGTPATAGDSGGASLRESMARYEVELITSALARHDGRVAAAAEALGLTRAGLYKKINKYGIDIDNSRKQD